MRAPRASTSSVIFAASLVLGLDACTHDVVLPDHSAPAVCGDGVVEAGEGCDVDSPGCVDCQVSSGWTCSAADCSQTCADGGVIDGSDAAACGTSGRSSACDLTGFWAVRETTYLVDTIFQSVQVSSNWYLYEVTQTGNTFALTASLDCGVHVTGSATIDYPPSTKQSMIWLNPEDGTDSSRGQREGTSTGTSSGGCNITLSPWFFTRGVTTAYLPETFSENPPLSSLPTLPSVTDPINGDEFPSGATDPTTPGIPGVGTIISGLAPGERYSAQRSTTSFASNGGLDLSSGTFAIPGTFDVDENVLRVTNCAMVCPLLTTVAIPSTQYPPHATWKFVGKSRGTASVDAIVVAKPRGNLDQDLQTCANVQTLLPHDGTAPQ